MQELMAGVLILSSLCFQAKSDPSLEKVLLEHDSREAKSGPEMIGIGDDIFALSKKYPKSRTEVLDHASAWWAKGWPLLDVVWRDKTRENLRKLYYGSPVSRALTSREWKGEKVIVSGERVHSGGFAACLKMPKGNEGNYHQPLKWESTLPAGVQEVVVSAWVLTDETNNVNDDLKPTLFGPNGELVYATGTAIPMDLPVWKRLEIKIPAKGAVKMNLIFEFQSRSGVCFVDDVAVRADQKDLIVNGSFEK